MNGTSDISLIAERLESLKAGIIGGLSLGVAFFFTSLFNSLVLAEYFSTLKILQVAVDWPWFLSGAIAGFSGLLFGVTYRYIVRQNQNLQLKTGGVLAFGLVRGLTQIEVGWKSGDTLLPYFVLAGESLLWFALGAIALNFVLHRGWLKPFQSF